MNQKVIFSTGLDIQRELARILDATGIADQETRAVIESVIETAKKESPAIVSTMNVGTNVGTNVDHDSREAKAGALAGDRLQAAVLAANKTLLLRALAAAGVTTASVECEGSDDEGGPTGLSCDPVSNLEGQEVIRIFPVYGWTSDRFVKVFLKKMDLEDALYVFVNGDLTDHFDHSGYWNGEGGGCEAVFDVKNEKIVFSYYEYEVVRANEETRSL